MNVVMFEKLSNENHWQFAQTTKGLNIFVLQQYSHLRNRHQFHTFL